LEQSHIDGSLKIVARSVEGAFPLRLVAAPEGACAFAATNKLLIQAEPRYARR
jgi:hypothetical protein